MKPGTLNIRLSVWVNKPPEIVWDFTQDYARRPQWDSLVIRAEVVSAAPPRQVRLYMRSNTSMTFVYKLDDRPHKTTLAAQDVQSPFIQSCGGSWAYEPQDGGTLWTQTNTIILKPSFLLRILTPFLRLVFYRQTKQAMNKAKKQIETEP